MCQEPLKALYKTSRLWSPLQVLGFLITPTLQATVGGTYIASPVPFKETRNSEAKALDGGPPPEKQNRDLNPTHA